MNRVWRVVITVAGLMAVVGAALIVVSLLTGGSLDDIRNHGSLTMYAEVLREWFGGLLG